MAIFRKSVPAKAVVVPTLAEASPEYAAMIAKQRELEAKRGEIEAELRSIQKGRIPAGLVAKVTGGRGERATELLGDLAGDETYTFRPSGADIADHESKLRQQAGDVDAALAILKTKIPTAAKAASCAAVEQVRDGYNGAVRRTALTLIPALAAHREMLRIIGDLNDNDIRWTAALTQPASLRRVLGELWDRETTADRFISDAIAAGIVTPAEIEEAGNA